MVSYKLLDMARPKKNEDYNYLAVSSRTKIPIQPYELTKLRTTALPGENNVGPVVITRKLCRPSADIFCGRPPDVRPFEVEIGTPVTPIPWGTFTPILFFFLHLSFFGVRSSYGTDRRWKDGRARPVMRPSTQQ